MGTLHDDKHTLQTISCSIGLRMRNASKIRCTKNQNTNFDGLYFFF